MTSLATNHIAFPEKFDMLTERRTTAQSWKNALQPFFRYVNIGPVEIDGKMEPGVVADNGANVVISLKPSTTVRGHYDLWDAEIFFRSSDIARIIQVGTLRDLLTSVTCDI